MRKILLCSGLALLLLGVWSGWRALHPPLSDEQQISVALDGIVEAANSRQPRGIMQFLAPDFKFQGGSRKDFQNSLVGGILQFRGVDLQLSGVEVVVKVTTATSAGRFRLSLKSEANSTPEITNGGFNLKWKKVDGQWLIGEAEMQNPGLAF